MICSTDLDGGSAEELICVPVSLMEESLSVTDGL